MRGKLQFSTLFCAVALLIATPASADKITVDPNGPQAACAVLTETEASRDERLAQPMTYDSGYKRLSTVLDEITQLCGVSVRTGRNKQDWQVRDLPMQVSARNIPLGKLLRAVADTTHLAFVSDRLDDRVVYRIYRGGQRARQLQAFFDSRIAEQMAKEEQAWETMLLLKNVNSEQFMRETKSKDAISLDYCKVVAALGPEVKAKVFSGETIRLEYGSLPAGARAPFERAARALWQRAAENNAQLQEEDPDYPVKPLDPFDAGALRGSSLEIGFSAGGHDGLAGVVVKVNTPADCWELPTSLIPWLAGQLRGIEIPKIKDQQEQMPLGYERLPRAEGKWLSLPGLDKEIKIEKWASSTDPTLSDFTKALASASGLTIIYEDYLSHGTFDRQILRGLFGSTSTVVGLLNQLGRATPHSGYRPDWSYSQKGKTLIGWDHTWQVRHVSLVRASYLDRLRSLMNSSGVELDDFLQVTLLAEGQRGDWIVSDAELNRLNSAESCGPIWKLYAQLTAENRLLAWTDTGLPIAKLGIDVARLLDEQNAKLLADSDPEGFAPELINAAPSDLQSATMRVRAEPVGSKGRHSYAMEILDTDHRVIYAIKLLEWSMCNTFPVYSEKRQAELAKAGSLDSR